MHEFIAIQLLIPGGSSSRPSEQLETTEGTASNFVWGHPQLLKTGSPKINASQKRSSSIQ
jgi:hypothetical protein